MRLPVTYYRWLYRDEISAQWETCKCLASEFDEHIREHGGFPEYVQCIYEVFADGSRRKLRMGDYVNEVAHEEWENRTYGSYGQQVSSYYNSTRI